MWASPENNPLAQPATGPEKYPILLALALPFRIEPCLHFCVF